MKSMWLDLSQEDVRRKWEVISDYPLVFAVWPTIDLRTMDFQVVALPPKGETADWFEGFLKWSVGPVQYRGDVIWTIAAFYTDEDSWVSASIVDVAERKQRGESVFTVFRGRSTICCRAMMVTIRDVCSRVPFRNVIYRPGLRDLVLPLTKELFAPKQ